MMTAADLILARTRLGPVPLVPEVTLYQAEEPIGLWEETERRAGQAGLAPPFWAFAWAGGQALARYVLDNAALVAGRTVLDLASGSGLVAIAAALAGAADVTAAEIDPLAVAAIGMNARHNGVAVRIEDTDVLAGAGGTADVVLAGDASYERELANRVFGLADRALQRGAMVLVGDPGRAYLPRDRLAEVAVYDCPVNPELEGVAMRRTVIWRIAA